MLKLMLASKSKHSTLKGGDHENKRYFAIGYSDRLYLSFVIPAFAHFCYLGLFSGSSYFWKIFLFFLAILPFLHGAFFYNSSVIINAS